MLVALVHPKADRYGADEVALQILDALLAARHTVDLYVAEGGPLTDRAAQRGASANRVPTLVIRHEVISIKGALRALREATLGLPRVVAACREHDVVYINTITLPLWVAASWALGKRTIIHTHETLSSTRRVVAKILYAPCLFASSIVAVSDATAEAISDAYPALRPRIRVIRNAIFDAEDANIQRDSDHLVVVGRLSPRKGQDVVLEALARMKRPPAHTHFFGDTFRGYEWYEASLRAKIHENSIDATLHGYAERTAAYAAGDVVVFPSTQAESSPLVLLEAMAAGKVIIASDVGGVAELLGDAGLLVPPSDPEALATALESILGADNEQYRREYQARAIERSQLHSPKEFRTAIAALVADQT